MSVSSKNSRTGFDKNPAYFDHLSKRLAGSTFRSSFHLKKEQLDWIQENGMEKTRSHAADFIEKRLAPAEPLHDGKQTPMKGHPVFIAQHATGCCCRNCLEKWHHIPKGRPLSAFEQAYIVEVLMDWIENQLRRSRRS